MRFDDRRHFQPLAPAQRSSCGSRTSAATAVSAFTASRTRRIVPRLRKSGSARAMVFCLIIDCIAKPACKLRAGKLRRMPTPRHRRFQRLLSATRCGRGKLEPDATPDRGAVSPVSRFLGAAAFLTRRATEPFAMADAKPPVTPLPQPDWSGRFGEPVAELVKRYTASVDFDRRLAAVDIAGSLAHARMLAATGVLRPTISPRSSAGWGRFAARSSAASSRGRATSRTSTSTSRSG